MRLTCQIRNFTVEISCNVFSHSPSKKGEKDGEEKGRDKELMVKNLKS